MKIANLKDPKNKNLLLKFQDKVLNEFNRMLKDMANTNYKKSSLITYWLNDYKNYLHREEFFTPKKLVKYKRGSIIKANLGFNLGNEQGGLHYCIVLNKNDTINIPTLNVIPLTSIKDPEKKLHYTNVKLGNEVYNILVSKVEENSKLNELYLSNIESMNHIVDEMLSHLTMCKDFGFDKEILNSSKPILDMLLTDFKSIINDIDWKDKYLISAMKVINDMDINIDGDIDYKHILNLLKSCNDIIGEILEAVNRRIAVSRKILEEISKMKKGSIAHVDQITTISKMRIYNPKSTWDALYNIRLSNESLTEIDNKIKELFTY